MKIKISINIHSDSSSFEINAGDALYQQNNYFQHGLVSTKRLSKYYDKNTLLLSDIQNYETEAFELINSFSSIKKAFAYDSEYLKYTRTLFEKFQIRFNLHEYLDDGRPKIRKIEAYRDD